LFSFFSFPTLSSPSMPWPTKLWFQCVKGFRINCNRKPSFKYLIILDRQT
jgi:hypothetical protein